MKDLPRLYKLADRAMSQHRLAKRAIANEKAALDSAEQRLEDLLDAQKILQHVAASIQTIAHKQITSIVTKALRTVFPDDGYKFRINFNRKRGKTEAQMVFVKNGIEIDPTTEDSGGVLDVAAFALRLSALLLSTPKRRRLLICDEGFKWVHGEDNRRRLSELLESLSKDLEIQMVFTTGTEWLRAGKIVEL